MLYSCKYCGQIHEKSFNCNQNKRQKKNGSSNSLRSTAAWQRKREEIRKRDLNMCQCCFWGIEPAENGRLFNSAELEVHHIVPISEDENLAFENENLICLCRRHHEMAENGLIKRTLLNAMATRIPPYTSDAISQRLATPTGNSGK